jgi:two-component system, LytTR family, sensor kinase
LKKVIPILLIIVLAGIHERLFSVESSENTINQNDSTLHVQERYNAICDSAYKYVFKREKALVYFDSALIIERKHSHEKSWKLMIFKAWDYTYRQKFDSVEYIINDITQNIVNDSSEKFLDIYYHLGYLNYRGLKYSKANASFEKLLALSHAKSNRERIFDSYRGLAKVADITKDYNLAKEHLGTLLDYLADDKSFDEGVTLQLYAEIVIKLEEYQLAYTTLKSAVKIFNNLQDSLKVSNVYNQLAWVYNALNMPDSAIYYYKQSLEVSERNNREILSSDSYGNLGLIYFNHKEYPKAIEYFDSILAISIRTNYTHYIKYGYYHLSNAYDSIGNYENAYYNYKKYVQLVDSSRKLEIENKYINERTKFETERKEKELEIVSLKYKNNRIILYLSLGFIVLIIIVAFLLYRQSKLKAKNRLSKIEKQLVELKQLSLRKQMNPHFVFNTLNSIQYFMFGNDKMSTNNYMSKFAMLVRKTFENSQYNSVPIKYELEALSLYMELEQLRFKKSFSFDIIVDDEIDILQHEIPTMLIQPFVENSINHGLHSKTSKGKLLVELKLIDNMIIECIIEDNGIGRERSAEINRVKNKNHQSLGTSITTERLNIIDSIMGNKLKIEYIDLKDETDKAIGTRVIIHIPILT